jgi:hypothetical protein
MSDAADGGTSIGSIHALPLNVDAISRASQSWMGRPKPTPDSSARAGSGAPRKGADAAR